MFTYSNSKLGTFKTCRLQYRFHYVDRIKMEIAPTIESFLGNRVHESLEWLYKLANNCKAGDVEEFLEKYHQLWDGEWSDDVRIIKREFTAENYRDVGEKCLRLYHARHYPFDDGIVLGIEKGFRFPLDETHSMNGYIDRISKTEDGVIAVHDYKTSSGLPTQAAAQKDRQGGIYAMAMEHLYPEAHDVRLIWHYLRFDERLITQRTGEALEALKADLLDLMCEIEAEKEFPAKESALCGWCDYHSICPAKGHRIKVRDLPPNEYLNEPGVNLVDRLVELQDAAKESKRQFDEEIDLVKDAIIAYAESEGVSVVVGSEKEANLKWEEKFQFPGKNDPDRDNLVNLLKELDVLKTFSDLSVYQLSRALRDGSLPPGLAEMIREHATQQDIVKVTLRRRRDRDL